MDKLTKEQRHHCMSSIHSKNTNPEILVRKFLFCRGFRYRVNCKKLPGHPDIVLRKYRTVIFVHGCFWHGHKDCRYFQLPKTNIEFWSTKIERNQARDTRNLETLTNMGWNCITIWECQLKPKLREQTMESLEDMLRHLYRQRIKRLYITTETPIRMVAEEPQEQD